MKTLRLPFAAACLAILGLIATTASGSGGEQDAGGWFTPAQRKALDTWFRGNNSGGSSTAWPRDTGWPKLASAQDVEKAKAALWPIYCDAHRLDPSSKELGPLPPKLGAPLKTAGLRPGTLTIGDVQMPFLLVRREAQPAPKEGRALYIALHGGGGNPRAAGPHDWPPNTQEWKTQAEFAVTLYPGEGIYFVPRMADDRQGRWHLAYDQDAFDKVIEHAIREWGVDSNRVYLMGISEGCFGTQILAPLMADRFAAACAMAGGISEDMPLENLRNVAFRTEVGENDTTFNRVGLAHRYHAALDEFAKKWGGYTNVLNVQPGRGHGIDYAIGPKWMIQYVRDPRPKTVVWTDMAHDGRRRTASYWLGLAGSGLEGRLHLVAQLENGGVKLTAEPGKTASFGDAKVRVMLDDSMLDLGRPVRIEVNGKAAEFPAPVRSIESLARTLAERGDPKLTFPAVIELAP